MRIHVCLALLLSVLMFPLVAQDTAATSGASDQPRVFITDSESWSVAGSSGGAGGAFGGHTEGGARPQTAEIVKTFGERCPQVVTNNRQERSDYVVVLDHEGGKGVLRHRNKVAVFNRVTGDSIVSKSTLSLGGSVQEACEAITKDWTVHAKDIRTAETGATTPEVKATTVAAADPPKTSAAKLSITSNPSGADIEIDGSFVGNTPSEIHVNPGDHTVSVSKAGYKPWQRNLKATGGTVSLSAELESEVK
jgi:hypothetical protein